MQKFQKLSLQNQAILIYLLSLGISIIVSPLFGKIYIKLLLPNFLSSGFFIYSPKLEIYLGGILLAYFLFLPFFTFLYLKQKQWKIWAIGTTLPFLIFLTNGFKYILWAVIFSVIGWALAQGILLIKNNYKK